MKMIQSDVNVDTYVNSGAEHNDGNSKFKVGYNVLISKSKNVFLKKLCTTNWSEWF